MVQRSVAASNRGNMRHGLISLLTVVVIIALATAAVLAVATSHAMDALANRQAKTATEGYAAEAAAQTLVAELDDELQAARNEGTSDAVSLAARVESRANGMLAQACPDGVTATYAVEGTTLTCTFVTTSGRMLETTIALGDGATYDIVDWKLTAAPQVEDNGDTLWVGPTAGE